MARQIYEFQFTMVAGLAADTVQTMDMTIPVRTMNAIQITIPPGPSGDMGFAITVSGQPIIPYNDSSWVITDDEKLEWPLNGYPNSGAWGARGYNNGTYDHTIYVRLLVDVVLDDGATLELPTSSAALSS